MKTITQSDLGRLTRGGAKVLQPDAPKPPSNLPRSRTKGEPPVSRDLSSLTRVLDKQIETSRLQTADLLRGLIKELNKKESSNRNLTFEIERSPDGLMQRIHVTETTDR